jgi:hypothetical protein
MAEEISPLEDCGWWMERLRKDAKANRHKALFLADVIKADPASKTHHDEAAAELRRLHAENKTLRKQHLEAHRNSSTIFAALVEISLLTHLGGEVAEYGDVVDAVRRLRKEKAGLLEALKFYGSSCDATESTPCGYEGNLCCKRARAAIARAEGEKG